MNEAKRNQMNDYFEVQTEQCREQIRVLEADLRGDEAVFARVRLNIYDAFRAVFSAGMKLAGEDDGKLTEFFLEKLEQIPRNWQTSLDHARAHDETEKAHIEGIKLETAGEIRRAFAEIWEADQ